MTHQGSILAVDDTRATLRILTALLRGAGYEVQAVESGELALAAVAARPPELILLDIELPGIDGFEVLRQLKSREECREIPVIFLSSHTEPEMRSEGLKLGAVDFVSKPYHREELHARVHTHLELARSRARIAVQAAELQRANRQLQLDIAERERAETERAAIEARLHLAQKLESVGRLAAGVAHEINTPTQFISDNVRFLLTAFVQLDRVLASHRPLLELAASHPAAATALAAVRATEEENELPYLLGEIPHTLEQSLEGLLRIAKIVGSLKEFAHPGGAGVGPADLNRAVDNAIAVSRHEWRYVADIVTELSPQLPAVPCVLDEINQVLLNLLINAAHSIEEANRRLGRALGCITVRTRLEPGWAILEVEDNGTGIPPDVQQRLFEPFFTTKGVGKGTGQGLGIARSVVVNAHAGRLDFITEVGRGTTFRIALPLADRPSAPASPSSP